MKVTEPKKVKLNRIRVLVQSLSEKGIPVGGKEGYAKAKQISLYETTIGEVYNICLKALKEK